VATQKDVARRAGVSVATVSMVLAGRQKGRVTDAVSARVRAAADELGYVPNLIARSLKTRRTKTIGLLSDEVASTPFAGAMLAGAQREAWRSGYLLISVDMAGDQALEAAAIQALTQRNVDALIYASMYDRVIALPSELDQVPVVLLDARPEAGTDGVDWVVPDEAGGAAAAVQELIDLGHVRIGFCNQADDVPARRERLAGYLAAHTSSGLPVDDSLIVDAQQNEAVGGYDAALQLLRREDRPTAIFCFSDRIAMGVYRAAAELGISIPGDLSVVGFDNLELIAAAVFPPLTTVQLPHEAMGVWAARRAVQLSESDDEELVPQHLEMTCPLVRRGSTGPPPISG
jgi:LacI family transcriptional regulator